MFLNLRASTADRAPWGDFWYGPVAGRIGAAGQGVTPATALTQSAVYACVRVRAESFALLPFRLYQPRVGGGRKAITKHWLRRLFCRRPNRWQTPYAWREMLQAHLDLRGNAYCEIIEDGTGGIAELIPRHPDRIQVELVGTDEWRYVYTQPDGTRRYLTRGQVWHLRGLGDNGITGFSPIAMHAATIGEALQYTDYASNFFHNNATPPAWIKFPGKFADDAARNHTRDVLQAAQTDRNRGKLMVLDQGMELHAVAINHRDMQFLEARQAKVPEIARLFRVPLHKIGDLTNATFSNIEQQAIEFWQDSIQPIAERWESSIECDLLGNLGDDTDLEIEFDMRSQMRGDSAARSQYLHNMVLDGILNRNEARSIEGFDPAEGLDEFLVPVNERGIDDPDPNGEAGPGEEPPDALDAPPADARATASTATAAPAPAATAIGADAATQRLHTLLRDNAQRMARRITGNSPPSAQLLADALAISVPHAQAWLKLNLAEVPADHLATALYDLATQHATSQTP